MSLIVKGLGLLGGPLDEVRGRILRQIAERLWRYELLTLPIGIDSLFIFMWTTDFYGKCLFAAFEVSKEKLF